MIASHKGEIPFIVLLLPFLAGIGLDLYFPSASYILIFEVLLFLFSLAFTLLNIAYKRFNLYKFKWLGGVLIHAILLLLGLAVVSNYNELNNTGHFSKKSAGYLLIKINNEPKLTGDLLRFTATVEANVFKNKRTISSGTLLITIKDSAARNLYYGDELLMSAKYNPIDPPFNPAEFNYKKYLANQNIYYQAFLNHGQYFILNRDAGNPIIAWSLRLRRRLVEKLKTNMHDPDAVAVASTLILGYKADLSNEVLQAYSKTGTVHVLSVSGAHVAILFILLSFVLSFLDKFRHGKQIKAALIVTVIWYYALLTGFSPAVCRAAVMISMYIIGKTFSRNINTLNILAVSAFFLLLYDPLFITDVGFQLSYLAVFGLVVLQPVVYNWLDIKNKWADKLWALCSVSIAAQVITFPLSAFYFHQFPVYFLVSNLFIIIPSAIIMYAGLAYLFLPSIPFISPALAYVLEHTILLMNKVLASIEHTPYAGINKIWITTSEYLLLYAIIISIFYFLYEQKKWLLKFSLFCLLLLAMSFSIKRWHNLTRDEITFLNLRKHIGIVFKAGNRAIVVSDIKDTDKTYRYSVQPYLDSCQVNEIKIAALDSSVQSAFFLKRNHLMLFADKKVLLFDKQLQKINLPQKLKVDYLYVCGSPDTDIGFINKNYDYSFLVIDDSNSNSLILRLEAKANQLHIKYWTLKRNKSLTLISN